jgi:hypothetical protein
VVSHPDGENETDDVYLPPVFVMYEVDRKDHTQLVSLDAEDLAPSLNSG